MGVLPLEKEKFGHFEYCHCMWCGCWCPRARLCRRRISVTNESHVARRVLTACHYRQCCFPLACSWKGLEMILISFLKWLGEGLRFVLSRFGERRNTLLFVCAEFTIILLSRSDFLRISKIIELLQSERRCEEKEGWRERKEETVVKQVRVFFLGLGGVFILQQLFLVRRGGCGEGGVTVGACNGVWHLLSRVAGRNCTSASSSLPF